MTVAEDPFSGRRIQPFGQRSEHHGDLMGRGFQTVQGRMPSSTERGAAGLTAKGLDPFGMAMLAIANESMNVSIGDAEVWALLVGTSEPLGVYAFGGSSAAFDLAPRAHRRRCRSHNGQVGAGEATGGTVKWGAWLEEKLSCRVDGLSL